MKHALLMAGKQISAPGFYRVLIKSTEYFAWILLNHSQPAVVIKSKQQPPRIDLHFTK